MFKIWSQRRQRLDAGLTPRTGRLEIRYGDATHTSLFVVSPQGER